MTVGYDVGGAMSQYDVIYIDSQGAETALAEHMDDRQEAAGLASAAAKERGAGRMVLPGSHKMPNCVCVVPSIRLPER